MVAPKGLVEARINKDKARRIVSSVEALQKRGKTHFGLTMPGPIAFLDLNADARGVMEKFVKEGKKILYGDFSYDRDDGQDAAKKLWKRLEESYYDALESKSLRSVLTDTGTDAWELVRFSDFGKLDKVMPRDYGWVNSRMKRLIQAAKKSDKNVCFTHRLTEVYVNDKRTDKMELKGFSGMEYDVEVNVRLTREKDNSVSLVILDCRMNRDAIGVELVEPLCDFPSLAIEVYPDSEREEWE